MAESDTVVRPYAKAVFALAIEQKAVEKWEAILALGAQIVSDNDAIVYLKHPQVTEQRAVDLFTGVSAEVFDEQGQRLLHLLAVNRRLLSMPAILKQFELLVAQWKNTVPVNIRTANTLGEVKLSQLTQAIEKRLQCQVSVCVEEDAQLLAGAVVRIGDEVIDGSVRGRLERLAESLGTRG